MKIGLDVSLFNITYFLYFGGFLAYSLYFAFRKKVFLLSGINLLILGILPHTAAFFIRWYLAKHIPLSNMYEYLSVMCWMSVITLVVVHFKYKIPLIGALISPIVVMLMTSAALLPKEINQSLMPALQSIWLHIHVSMAAIGSGGFMIAYSISTIFLVRNFKPDPNQSTLINALILKVLLFLVGIPFIFMGALSIFGLTPSAPDSELQILGFVNNFGKQFILLGLAFSVSAIVFSLSWSKLKIKVDGFGGWLFALGTLSFLSGGILTGALVKFKIITLTHNLHDVQGQMVKSAWLLFEFVGITYLVGLFLALLIIPLMMKLTGITSVKSSKSLKILDEISYKIITLAYPLWTIGALFAGAIWAEQAWGSFWSWDPKETGALIVWLFFSGYLHARYNRGWSGSKAAVLVLAGFIMVIISFFGNYFFGGLHAYA